MRRDLTCSVQWDDSALPAAGSASSARFWVGLEQNGPWGHDAIASSRLPEGVGPALDRAVSASGGRVLLLRRPGRHQDTGEDALRTCLVAGGPDDDRWLLEGEVERVEDLVNLPWGRLVDEGPDAVSERLPLLEETREVSLLVCTNSKRDQCCAVRGRPIAVHAEAERPGRVWECSHIGGHRFAPAALALPSGLMYARLTPESSVAVLDAERRREIAPEVNDVVHNRGRTSLSKQEQVAEVTVRAQIGEVDLEALSVEPSGDDVVVRHRDGRRWQVRIEQVDGPLLKSSCLKDPKPADHLVAHVVG